MVRSAALIAASIALATIPASVNAHGSMSVPKVSFKDISNRNAPSVTSPGQAGPYTGNDEIKGLAEKAGSKCGKTDANAAAQPIPADGMVVFDISAQHIGPCEIWLDETKVVSAKECWKEFPDKKIKVDFSSCKSGSCLLRWVWMATHTSPWEFFDNCARVGSGGGGGAASSGGASGGDNSKPATPTTKAPSGAPANMTMPSSAPASASPYPAPVPKPMEQTPGTVKPMDDGYSPSGGQTKPSASGGSCYRGKGDKNLDAWCTANCAMGFCPEAQCEKC